MPDLEVGDLAGGLLGPNDGHLDGHLLCEALIADAIDHEAEVRRRASVTAHEANADGSHTLTVNDTELIADVVINTAGPWTGPWRPPWAPCSLGSAGAQSHSGEGPRDLGYTVPMVNLYMPGQSGEALYFRQDGPDSLIAGMHTYAVLDNIEVADPDSYRSKVGDDYLVEVAEALSTRFRVEDLGFKPGWTGLYPLSPDSKFILGPESDPTIITCAGLGGVGVTMGAIAGATAAEWGMQGRPTTVPSADALRPDRTALVEARAKAPVKNR